MRASSACFLLSQSAPTAIRPYNGAENAARCIGHRTALHTASQRAAQAIAPHCTTEGRTGGRNREGCGEDGRTRCHPLRSWMRKQAERALPTAEKEQKKVLREAAAAAKRAAAAAKSAPRKVDFLHKAAKPEGQTKFETNYIIDNVAHVTLKVDHTAKA